MEGIRVKTRDRDAALFAGTAAVRRAGSPFACRPTHAALQRARSRTDSGG